MTPHPFDLALAVLFPFFFVFLLFVLCPWLLLFGNCASKVESSGALVRGKACMLDVLGSNNWSSLVLGLDQICWTFSGFSSLEFKSFARVRSSLRK